MKKFLRNAALSLISLTLVACGGGGGSGSSVTEISLSGSVGDGPVVGASVSITDDAGNTLATSSSNNNANFTVTIQDNGSQYPLTLLATGGTDIVSNTTPDFSLYSISTSNSENMININPHSTMAYHIASQSGAITSNSFNNAKQTVLNTMLFGLDLNIMPDPVLSPVTDNNAAHLIKSSEVFSEMIRRTRDLVNNNGGNINANQLFVILAADLSDGVLDGQGLSGADPRIAAYANITSAYVMIEAMNNNLFVNGASATQALNNAIQTVKPNSTNTIGDVAITSDMLNKTTRIITAANAVNPDPGLSNVLNQISTISAGTTPAQNNANINTASLDTSISFITSASTTELTNFNNNISNSTPNMPPVISGSPATGVNVGSRYSFTPSATDANGDNLTFSISNKPAWASFSTASGRLSGTPAAGNVGSFNNIVISVSDGTASSSLSAFGITVNQTNVAPVISGSPATSVNVGSNYSFTPSATDANGDNLTFSISNKPAWASFSTASGRLSGTPSAGNVGSFNNIVISVSDGTASSSLSAFGITVNQTNVAPVISGSPATSVNVGSNYSFTPSATDANGDNLTFSISNKPAWASFSTASGRLSGTPAAGNVGSFNNIVISVSDGTASSSLAAFSITVNQTNVAPVISGTPATSVNEGASYSFTPSVTDADGDNLTFGISNKPAWATFNTATGQLSGTPDFTQSGVYASIVIGVSDGSLTDSLPAFTINVINVNQAPVISGTPASSVTVGSSYQFTPTATDPDSNNLSFSITGKPAWAAFNNTTGQLAGAPTSNDTGTYNVTISVSDGSSSDSMSFSITVNAGTPTTKSLSLNWTAPQTYNDGSPLSPSDISGYRVYFGTSSSSIPLVADINDGTTTSYTINNLTTGNYYLSISSYDINGIESTSSDTTTIVVP